MSFTSSPLNYPQGANTAINRFVSVNNPLPSNWQNFIPGDEWLNKITKEYWKMISNAPENAVWVQIGGPTSDLQTLTGNTGGPVPGDPTGNINTVGDGISIQAVGNPTSNTLTFSTIAGAFIQTVEGNTGGPVAADSGGTLQLLGDNVNITVVGDPVSNTLTISGSGGGGGGTVSFLEGNDTNAVPPDGSGIIYLLGDNVAIKTTGDIGTDTVTISLISPLSVDLGGTGAITLPSSGILIGNGTSPVTGIDLTNGQILIGSTGTSPSAATITAGPGINISNAAGSITVSSTGGVTWSVVTSSTQTASVNNGYIANYSGLCVITLPTTAAAGTVLGVSGMNNATGWKIAQNSGQQIFFGTSSTTSGTGGSLASSSTYDSVYMVCNVANTSWIVLGSVGNITVV